MDRYEWIAPDGQMCSCENTLDGGFDIPSWGYVARELLRLASENARLVARVEELEKYHADYREGMLDTVQDINAMKIEALSRAERVEAALAEAEEAIKAANQSLRCACNERGKCLWHERPAVVRALAGGGE